MPDQPVVCGDPQFLQPRRHRLNVHATAAAYEPFFAHYQAERSAIEAGWESNIRTMFDYRREHLEARPPRTLAAQTALATERGAQMRPDFLVAKNLTELAASKGTALQFEPLDPEARRQFSDKANKVLILREKRGELEIKEVGWGLAKGRKNATPIKIAMPESPIADAGSVKSFMKDSRHAQVFRH